MNIYEEKLELLVKLIYGISEELVIFNKMFLSDIIEDIIKEAPTIQRNILFDLLFCAKSLYDLEVSNQIAYLGLQNKILNRIRKNNLEYNIRLKRNPFINISTYKSLLKIYTTMQVLPKVKIWDPIVINSQFLKSSKTTKNKKEDPYILYKLKYINKAFNLINSPIYVVKFNEEIKSIIDDINKSIKERHCCNHSDFNYRINDLCTKFFNLMNTLLNGLP